MRKSLKVLVLVGVLSIASTFTSLASWEQIGTQWKYSENNGYVSNGWYWLDGDSNGVAECYYLDVNGILAVSTTVESYTVNENGAWTVNNVVQTKVINSGSSGRSESSQNQSNSGIPSLYDITGTVGSTEWGDTQCGDSTGLPPMQSGAGGSGGSSSSSQSTSSQTGGSLFDRADAAGKGQVGDTTIELPRDTIEAIQNATYY